MVEFVVLAVGALVPIALVAPGLLQVQGLHADTEIAAAEAARAFATAATESEARHRGTVAARAALGGMGVASSDVTVRFRCDVRPCLTPGSQVQAEVTAHLPAGRVPVLGGLLPTTSTAVGHASVDRYRAVP